MVLVQNEIDTRPTINSSYILRYNFCTACGGVLEYLEKEIHPEHWDITTGERDQPYIERSLRCENKTKEIEKKEGYWISSSQRHLDFRIIG